MRIGFLELLVILVIGLLVFGGTQLPKLAKAIGQSKRILDEELELNKKDEQQALADAVMDQEKDDEK